MKRIILFDTKDPERSQVRFNANYHGAEIIFVNTVFDLFESVEELGNKSLKPNVIVLEAEFPKDEKGMLFGNKRVRSPFAIVQFLAKKGHRFVIYTRGTSEKSFNEIVKTYERIHVEVLNKDCEKEDFRRVLDRYLLDFDNAKVTDF
ncbi:MAG: hypothetical protein V1906_03055 [Candidatus Woesearchaeota archaeon]